MKRTASFLIFIFAIAGICDLMQDRDSRISEFISIGKAGTNIVDGAFNLRIVASSYSGPRGTGVTYRATWIVSGATQDVRVVNIGPETERERSWSK